MNRKGAKGNNTEPKGVKSEPRDEQQAFSNPDLEQRTKIVRNGVLRKSGLAPFWEQPSMTNWKNTSNKSTQNENWQLQQIIENF